MALSLDEALGMSLADEADESIHVDVNTRQITIPESQKLFGVESDADVEVKHIVIDGRYADGNRDLSKLAWRVIYRNANKETSYYLIPSVVANENSIEMDWLIKRSVVAYKGTVDFILCAFATTSSGEVTPEWNSTLGQGMVLEGLETSAIDIGKESVDELSKILYETIAARDAAAKSAADADRTASSINESMTQIAANKEAVSQLKEDKLDTPTNPVVGQVLRVKAIDETGKIVLETATGTGKVEDLSNIISPNLFNPAVAKANVAISSNDGSEMNGFSGWETTDYIPVSKGEVLYFSANNEPTYYSTGAFYDKNKQRVDSFGNPNNNNNNIAVTSDGYARFSFDSKKEKLQIEKGSRTTYVPYGELKIKADVDNVKEETDNIKAEVSGVKAEVVKIQEDHTNLFNKDAVVKGAVLSENGYFDTSFSSWDSSDYIPIKPGMVLYFSSNELPIGVASTGAYFDADKKYLSGINNEPTVLTVPDGAYYLRFSKNGGLGDTLKTLKIEQHGITKFTPYGELYVTVTESALPSSILPKWKGLKILTLGDSITAMGGCKRMDVLD